MLSLGMLAALQFCKLHADARWCPDRNPSALLDGEDDVLVEFGENLDMAAQRFIFRSFRNSNARPMDEPWKISTEGLRSNLKFDLRTDTP